MTLYSDFNNQDRRRGRRLWKSMNLQGLWHRLPESILDYIFAIKHSMEEDGRRSWRNYRSRALHRGWRPCLYMKDNPELAHAACRMHMWSNFAVQWEDGSRSYHFLYQSLAQKMPEWMKHLVEVYVHPPRLDWYQGRPRPYFCIPSRSASYFMYELQLYSMVKDGYKRTARECPLAFWEDETRPERRVRELYEQKTIALGKSGERLGWGHRLGLLGICRREIRERMGLRPVLRLNP